VSSAAHLSPHYVVFSIPITLSLLGPNIFPSTLISNTLNLPSSVKVRNQFSHPYKTTGRIRVLYILIFIFLDSKI